MKCRFVVYLAVSIIAGCNTDEPSGGGTTELGTDTNTDGDVDTDTDADTDADSDVDTDDGMQIDPEIDRGCRTDFDCYGGEVCSEDRCITAGLFLINPSGEINGGENRGRVDEGTVVGWDAAGGVQMINDNTEFGNGGWRFSLPDDGELFQMTAHAIETGASYGLRFDAAPFSGLPSQLDVELYVATDDDRTAVASWTVDIKNPNNRGAWAHYNVAVRPGDLDDHAGEILGVRFMGVPDDDAERYLSLDNIRLDYWPEDAEAGCFATSWGTTPDRVFAAPGMWANRMQDWAVEDGRLVCVSDLARRTVHRTDISVRGNTGNFALTVETGLHQGTLTDASRSGFQIGAGFNLDWRGGMLVHQTLGQDTGIFCGLTGNGAVVIEDNNDGNVALLASGEQPEAGIPEAVRLELAVSWLDPDYKITVKAFDRETDTLLSEADVDVPPDVVVGSFGLLSHPGVPEADEGDDDDDDDFEPARFWFNNLTGIGTKLQDEPERHLTIFGALYTLSRGTLKLTAQMAPLDTSLNNIAMLEVLEESEWTMIAETEIDPEAYTATFKVEGWDDTVNTPFRVRLPLENLSGEVTSYTYEGTIRRDPVDKEIMVVAGTTGQQPTSKSVQSDTFSWTPIDMYHPHPEVVRHMVAHRPDLIAMTGDQVYEGRPTPADNSSDFNRRHDYLYKWSLFLVQWWDLHRVIPAIVIPDDHDVYQGNLWGEGGVASGRQSDGGYTKPASFVKVVERTQTSNLPDPFDPTPVEQDIGVYYTGMVYGRLGMAILEDRKFKTGEDDPRPEEEAELLGDRQHDFIQAWNRDWAGQDVKLTVSQTPFVNANTHAGRSFTYNLDDKDTNGWPSLARDEAVELIRKSYMFHLAGDQHLATVLQHGIEDPRDAFYSFCVPSIANRFARVWDPANPVTGTTDTVSPYIGDYVDYFGNHLHMLAVANPARYYERSTNITPTWLHDQAPGYGIVRVHKRTRRIQFEAWPRYVDPAYPESGTMYPDWPIQISQFDNYGKTPAGFLPTIDTDAEMNPVVVVTDSTSGELVYAVRARGNRFRPPVFDNTGTFDVTLYYGDSATAADTQENLTSTEAGDGHDIVLFEAFPETIEEGEASVLRWDVEGTSSTLTIDQGVGSVEKYTVNRIGFIEVSPTETTTYTLTSDDDSGEPASQSVTVTVSAS